jgi:dUTP pyrophosphatase
MQIILTNLAKQLMSTGLKDPANPEQYASFIPFQGTPASAGFDLRACIDEPKKIAFGETLLVPCGFHLHIEDPNLVGKLYVRSSVGTKLGIVLANGTGIVDSDYQDEWMLALRCYRRENLYEKLKDTHEGFDIRDNEDFVTIYPAQRLAQVVFSPVKHPMFYHVESFTESSDRLGGFGSTDGKSYGG